MRPITRRSAHAERPGDVPDDLGDHDADAKPVESLNRSSMSGGRTDMMVELYSNTGPQRELVDTMSDVENRREVRIGDEVDGHNGEAK